MIKFSSIRVFLERAWACRNERWTQFGVLLVLTCLASWWALIYTDTWTDLGGALGVGGLFVALAVVVGLLPESTRKRFQDRFEESVLGTRGFGRLLLLAFLALVAAWLGSTSVEVVVDPSAPAIQVSACREPCGKDYLEGLMPRTVHAGESGKLLVWMPSFREGFFRAGVRVQASGLPDLVVSAPRGRRTVINAPTDFLHRPVILVRPSFGLSGLLRKSDALSWVRRNRSGDWTGVATGGRALWIGCDEGVRVPALQIEKWKADLLREDLEADRVADWLPPVALPGFEDLKPGEVLEIVVSHVRPENGGGRPGRVAEEELVVTSMERIQDWPMEVVIDE